MRLTTERWGEARAPPGHPFFFHQLEANSCCGVRPDRCTDARRRALLMHLRLMRAAPRLRSSAESRPLLVSRGVCLPVLTFLSPTVRSTLTPA